MVFSTALSLNARTQPVLNGKVKPRGFDLVLSELGIGEMFWRQLKFADFDVSEMSMSSLAIATARGVTPWVALPIFTMRSFFHTGILVRDDAGIEAPADLRGKRMGVLEYQQTSLVWIRGWLEHEHGVTARDIEWFMQRPPAQSHGGSTGFQPPEGVKLSYVAPNTEIGAMLLAHEVDALPFYPQISHDLIDKSSADLRGAKNVRPLFPDVTAEARRYFAKTNIFPINHGVVIRRAIAEKHPEVARELLDCFIRANAYNTQLRASLLAPARDVGLIDAAASAALTEEPLTYGIKTNRPTLDALFDYIYEQGLSARRVGIEEIFDPSILDV